MGFKIKKPKISDITNPSHRATNAGGPISIRNKKFKIPKITDSINPSKFKNLMRF
jgi:hypothetical protein